MTTVETFKGNNPALKGEIFSVGPNQASQYDSTLKSILGYIAEKYDHRIHTSIMHKDKSVGMRLRPRLTAPTKKDPNDLTKDILDKDGEAWVEYQITMKKYVERVSKFQYDLQQIYNILYGQCSPSMQQTLSTYDGFKILEEAADSIKLLETIEKICYDYQPHEYPPLAAWESIDKLGKSYQPEHMVESEYYENMKTMVEVCKASGVNFALMCTHTVDMAITELHDANEISAGGKWKDGAYFTLTSAESDKVNERAEEICLSTRFLSLSSDKIFSASKQELKNDLVKGRNNYPKTIPVVLNFLQFHKLTRTTSIQGKTPQLETAFMQD